MHWNRLAKLLFRVRPQGDDHARRAGQFEQRLRQHDAFDIDRDAGPVRDCSLRSARAVVTPLPSADSSGIMRRSRRRRDAVGHDIGVDAALDEADG